MDDGRVVRVQVHQALQHLPRPALQHLLVDLLVLFAVLPQRPRREELGDEVHGEVLLVEPAVEEAHDVLVLQLLQHADLGKEPLALPRRHHQVVDLDLVPRDLDAVGLVKGLVDGLERAAAQDGGVLAGGGGGGGWAFGGVNE